MTIQMWLERLDLSFLPQNIVEKGENKGHIH